MVPDLLCPLHYFPYNFQSQPPRLLIPGNFYPSYTLLVNNILKNKSLKLRDKTHYMYKDMHTHRHTHLFMWVHPFRIESGLTLHT